MLFTPAHLKIRRARVGIWFHTISFKLGCGARGERADASNRKIEELYSSRLYKINGYKHFLVFPNLLISSTHGSSFNYSLIEPLTESTTQFTSYVFYRNYE